MAKNQKNDDPFKDYDHLFDETEEKYYGKDKKEDPYDDFQIRTNLNRRRPRRNSFFPIIGSIFLVYVLFANLMSDSTRRFSWIWIFLIVWFISSVIKAIKK